MASGEQEADGGTRGINAREIERRFTYHAPKGDQNERYIAIREQGKLLAEAVVKLTPACREQSLAVTKIEEAIMWANSAIARRE